jgi:hypothetical protein
MGGWLFSGKYDDAPVDEMGGPISWTISNSSQMGHIYQYWLVVWNFFYCSIQLGMSSSQLTNLYFSEK